MEPIVFKLLPDESFMVFYRGVYYLFTNNYQVFVSLNDTDWCKLVKRQADSLLDLLPVWEQNQEYDVYQVVSPKIPHYLEALRDLKTMYAEKQS